MAVPDDLLLARDSWNIDRSEKNALTVQLADARLRLSATQSDLSASQVQVASLLAQVASLEAALAECEGEPPPPPPPPPSAWRDPSGCWVIRQGYPYPATITGLNDPGIVGFGPRIYVRDLLPASGQFNAAPLTEALNKAASLGKKMKPRTIWGQYTPSFAIDRVGSDGAPIAGPKFFAAYRELAEHMATWAADKPSVPMVDQGWTSLNYSELYWGPSVRALISESQFIADHKKLMDISLEVFGPLGIPVGFGLSGHGPIVNIVKGLSEHALGKQGLYVQANGFAPGGEWGGQLEPELDALVWTKPLQFGLQDIHPANGGARTTAQIDNMFNRAEALGVTYVENYPEQWLAQYNQAGALARFKERLLAFDGTAA
jgi:hypothetical protein